MQGWWRHAARRVPATCHAARPSRVPHAPWAAVGGPQGREQPVSPALVPRASCPRPSHAAWGRQGLARLPRAPLPFCTPVQPSHEAARGSRAACDPGPPVLHGGHQGLVTSAPSGMMRLRMTPSMGRLQAMLHASHHIMYWHPQSCIMWCHVVHQASPVMHQSCTSRASHGLLPWPEAQGARKARAC